MTVDYNFCNLFHYYLHPWRLTWNIILQVWKIIFLSKWVICRFHVNLPGCNFKSRLWKPFNAQNGQKSIRLDCQILYIRFALSRLNRKKHVLCWVQQMKSHQTNVRVCSCCCVSYCFCSSCFVFFVTWCFVLAMYVFVFGFVVVGGGFVVVVVVAAVVLLLLLDYVGVVRVKCRYHHVSPTTNHLLNACAFSLTRHS